MKTYAFAAATMVALAGFASIASASSITNVMLGEDATGTSRVVESLNQGWQFWKSNATDPVAAADPSAVTVNLPHTWNSHDIQTGKDYYKGGGWYLRSIDVTKEDLASKRLFLKFYGVCSVADVYVNGKLLGEHKGGFSAFTFDATPLLKEGANLIEVRADNTTRPDVIPINTNLFALFGGMYRKVELIKTPKVCISPLDFGSSGVFITESNVSGHSADLAIKVDLQNFTNDFREVRLEAKVVDAAGHTVASGTSTSTISSGPMQPREVYVHMRNPHLWQGRDNPYLYTLELHAIGNHDSEDAVRIPFGVRTFGVEPGKGFLLNGRLYPLHGVCRHQDREDLGTALTDAETDEDAKLIDEIGATAVRLAHYQESQRIYSDMDRDGIVVWAESPFVNASSGKESENALQQYKELILQNYNHASIAFWGSSNEVYGKTAQSYVPTLIGRLALEAHELDPTRLSAATSGAGNPYGPEFGHADVQGVNRYYGWYYGKVQDLDTWFNTMKAKRPGMVYALTEYGAAANVKQQAEVLPTHVDSINGQYYPEGFQTKIHEQSWLIIEKHPECTATFIWNMFDFCVPGWNRGGENGKNLKGLVTYDRKTKKDAFFWYQAHWSKVPMVYLVNRRVLNYTTPHVTIEVFTNQGKPTITVNGKEVSGVRQGLDKHDWLVDVDFHIGANQVIASAGKAPTDQVTWNFVETLTGSKK